VTGPDVRGLVSFLGDGQRRWRKTHVTLASVRCGLWSPHAPRVSGGMSPGDALIDGAHHGVADWGKVL